MRVTRGLGETRGSHERSPAEILKPNILSIPGRASRLAEWSRLETDRRRFGSLLASAPPSSAPTSIFGGLRARLQELYRAWQARPLPFGFLMIGGFLLAQSRASSRVQILDFRRSSQAIGLGKGLRDATLMEFPDGRLWINAEAPQVWVHHENGWSRLSAGRSNYRLKDDDFILLGPGSPQNPGFELDPRVHSLYRLERSEEKGLWRLVEFEPWNPKVAEASEEFRDFEEAMAVSLGHSIPWLREHYAETLKLFEQSRLDPQEKIALIQRMTARNGAANLPDFYQKLRAILRQGLVDLATVADWLPVIEESYRRLGGDPAASETLLSNLFAAARGQENEVFRHLPTVFFSLARKGFAIAETAALLIEILPKLKADRSSSMRPTSEGPVPAFHFLVKFFPLLQELGLDQGQRFRFLQYLANHYGPRFGEALGYLGSPVFREDLPHFAHDMPRLFPLYKLKLDPHLEKDQGEGEGF